MARKQSVVARILPTKNNEYLGFIQVEYDGFVSSYKASGDNRLAVLRQLTELAKVFFQTVRD